MSENSTHDSRLSIVIPAFNEREGLPAVLEALTLAFPRAEIIVVDDASTDGTADAAAAFPSVTVLRHPFNRGYGGALKSGMRQATREFVAWCDADREHRAPDLQALVERIMRGDVAAVIAQRSHPGPSPVRRWGKAAIRLLARTFVPIPADINCGLRVFRSVVIRRYLPLLPNGYSASITSTMVMVERGYPLAFLPITTAPRVGRSKVKINDGFVALMLVMRTVMLFGPLRVCLSAGIALIAFGTIYGVSLALTVGLGIPTGAVVIVLTGVLLIVFGLIADQISQLRLSLYDDSPFEVVSDQQADQPRTPD